MPLAALAYAGADAARCDAAAQPYMPRVVLPPALPEHRLLMMRAVDALADELLTMLRALYLVRRPRAVASACFCIKHGLARLHKPTCGCTTVWVCFFSVAAMQCHLSFMYQDVASLCLRQMHLIGRRLLAGVAVRAYVHPGAAVRGPGCAARGMDPAGALDAAAGRCAVVVLA